MAYRRHSGGATDKVGWMTEGELPARFRTLFDPTKPLGDVTFLPQFVDSDWGITFGCGLVPLSFVAFFALAGRIEGAAREWPFLAIVVVGFAFISYAVVHRRYQRQMAAGTFRYGIYLTHKSVVVRQRPSLLNRQPCLFVPRPHINDARLQRFQYSEHTSHEACLVHRARPDDDLVSSRLGHYEQSHHEVVTAINEWLTNSERG